MFERCLYFNLNALARRVNKIWTQAFGDLGLSPAHAYLLRLVLERPGVSQQAIAAELKLEKSTVARFVEALEEKGYLMRVRSGREQRVRPTEAAIEIAAELRRRGDLLYGRMTENLGTGDLERLVSDLRSATRKLA